MKVRSVRTFLVDPGSNKRWLFVKVEADDGLYGWGECYTQADREGGSILITRAPMKPSRAPQYGPFVDLAQVEDTHAFEGASNGGGHGS